MDEKEFMLAEFCGDAGYGGADRATCRTISQTNRYDRRYRQTGDGDRITNYRWQFLDAFDVLFGDRGWIARIVGRGE